MATELTIAVANVNQKLCHDALFNNYDFIIDTSNSVGNENNRWIMEGEAARRNIYLWGTDQNIENAINGIPGGESYLSIADHVDSVLGELEDENLEERDKIQHLVSKKLMWSMNMQSQEWKIDKDNNKPIIECHFGSVYAGDHHFESLTYYRYPIREPKCSHSQLINFYEHIYSDLHHISQNTIYLIDYTYKVQCVDNEPYRYPIGIIFPYNKLTIDKYSQIQNNNIFSEYFNKYDNVNIFKPKVYALNDVESDDVKIDDNAVILKELKELNDELVLIKRSLNENLKNVRNDKEISEAKEDFTSHIRMLYTRKDEIEQIIKDKQSYMSECHKMLFKKPEKEHVDREFNHDNAEDDYDPKDSNMERIIDITHLFNGSLKNAMYKEIKDGKISTFESQIDMKDLKDAESIMKRYDSIENQNGEHVRKWLDIKRYTMCYYKDQVNITYGYGPLKIEGLLTPKKMEEMKKDPKYQDFTRLLEYDGTGTVNINALNICRLFADYSREHPNNQIQFIDDENICKKFRNVLNQLFNNGSKDERASIERIHKEGWTVHPINVSAFTKITSMSQPDQKKNIAKLGIIISQVYGGYVDNNCPIHALRGGMLLASSMYGDVYRLLHKTFTWNINITDHTMGWKKLNNDTKIKPMVRMHVYQNDFIRGRAGVCWNVYWNDSIKTDVKYGYPHFAEDSKYTQSSFDNNKVIDFHQKMINAEKWGDVKIQLDQLLINNSQFYTKSIQKDFYLDDKGILVSPLYYGMQIYYNVIANCNYKCVSTQTNRTTADKNEFKHSAAQRLLAPDTWFRPFQDEYDYAVICEGRSLSTKQQIRGRLERTYIDTIARNKDFQKFVDQSEREIVDNNCPITYPSKYIPWKFYTILFSLYINFMPLEKRKKIQGKMNDILLYPDVQMYDVEYDVSSIYGAVYQIFIEAYNSKKINKEKDIYHFFRTYQGANASEKLYHLKNTIPALYNIIIENDELGLDNYFCINFLYLLTCVNINSNIQKEIFVPICYCRSSNIQLSSIKMLMTSMRNYSSRYFPYLSRFFGLSQHENWNNNNDVLVDMRRKALDFYIGEVIISISKELSVCQTKLQNISMWVGSKCGGVSEAILFFQAITYPKAAYILIIIGDEFLEYNETLKEVERNYSTSFNSCKGLVMCKIKGDNVLDFKIVGNIKVRKLLRNFWGLSHDMLLIKSPGDIFGNQHIVTKLMNI
uniref:Outer capsid protein VP2 n=1 Tax=Changuinola virus TaxID=40052 RepID=U5YJ49_9REOV|nr:outer capsid protein VP2 [Changuinola virus]